MSTGRDKLFVYGTLRHRVRNRFAELLSRSGQLLGHGTVSGSLYQIEDYPGLVRSESAEGRVHGEIYRIGQREVWRALDEYEGCGPRDKPPYEFEREDVVVTMDDGTVIPATTYVYHGPIREKSKIASGDFLAHSGERT